MSEDSDEKTKWKVNTREPTAIVIWSIDQLTKAVGDKVTQYENFRKDTKQVNSQYMNRVSERIQQVLMEYVTRNYPDHEGRFLQLIMKLPELRAVR